MVRQARPGAVEVGGGVPIEPVDLAFALAAVADLPRWHARGCEPPARFGAARTWLRLRR